MRKLASVQTIKSIENIERDGVVADNIVLVKFESVAWQCVAKRGEFNVGDKAIYVEVSTVMPQVDVFAWLEAKKYKIKTQKIFGALSQGLPLPLSILNKFTVDVNLINQLSDGDDVTEIIGIKRIEDVEPLQLSGEQKGLFPTYLLPKTDEDRLQSYPEFLGFMCGRPAVATLKMDGSSCTVLVDPNNELTVCSRNYSLKESEKNAFWRAVRETELYDLANKPAFKHLAFQAELCGPGIQENRIGLDKLTLFVFNIVDLKNNKFFGIKDIEAICYELNLKIAPVVKEWHSFDETVESLLELAKGKYEGTKNHREGIVIRPINPVSWPEAGKWASIKVINNDYLLKVGE